MRHRAALVMLAAILVLGCSQRDREARANALAGGSAERAPLAIAQYGCGTCHRIPGLRMASGNVGPPLDAIAGRSYLAGRLPNTPANLKRWIQHPQDVVPGNAMPDLGVSDGDAADIAAYLYTLE
jgi:cytochrome c